MFSLGREEEPWGDLTHMCKLLMGKVKATEAGSSLWCPVERSRGNGHKLEFRKFRFNIRKKFLP